MIPLIPLATAVACLLLTGAVGAHAIQKLRAASAARLSRQQAAAAEDQAAQAAERLATDQRRRQHPDRYISVQRGRIAHEQRQLSGPIAHHRTQLAESKQALAEMALTGSLARQLLKCVGLFFLALAFALSAAQLIPSFRALGAAPTSAEAVVLGLIVAAIEVLIAFMLAHHLRPEHGWGPLSAKVAAALAVTFAALVVAAQVEWAPAHDTVPLRAKLATAQDALAQDEQNRGGATLITTDRQQIISARDQLARATTRDQGLALMVTLGADISAWPAIDALQYCFAARRRRRLRQEVAGLGNQVARLEHEHAMIPVRITFETQAELERLGIDPELVTRAALPQIDLPRPGSGPGPAGPGAGRERVPGPGRGPESGPDPERGHPEPQPGPSPGSEPLARPGATPAEGAAAAGAVEHAPDAPDHAGSPDPAADTDGLIFADSLFPPQRPSGDDRRWADPL